MTNWDSETWLSVFLLLLLVTVGIWAIYLILRSKRQQGRVTREALGQKKKTVADEAQKLLDEIDRRHHPPR